MVIKETLFPGQPGTRKLVEEYGDRLVCVRHRDDQIRHKRIRTVEIIIDEYDWTAEISRGYDNQVFVRIEKEESDVLDQIEALGGTWIPEMNAWQMNYRKALQIGLENRIIL